MDVVIIGGGAIGLLFYQAFAHHAESQSINLSLLTNTPTKSFSFTNYHGISYQVPIKYSSINDIAAADIILICVKSYQVDDVLMSQLPHINPQTKIVLCHNGMGAITTDYLSILKQQRMYTLLTTHGSKKYSSKHVVHTGLGQCDLGSINHQPSVEEKSALTLLLNSSLPCVVWQDNILQKQWLKLAINCVINPLTAINKIPNGDIMQQKYRRTILSIIDEFIQVAATQGLDFLKGELLDLILDVAKKTANNRSSMRSDIENRQLTEIDYINGYVVRLGEENSLNIAENKKLCQQIKQLTKLSNST